MGVKDRHVPGGVAVMLRPEAEEACKKAGSAVLSYRDRMFAVKLLLYNHKEKTARIFVVSANYPVGSASEAVSD